MKVTYINRSINFGGFSFEELFKTIKSNLKEIDYCDFYDKTYPRFLSNIKAVKKIPSDLYHITGGVGYYAFFLPTNKTILTIHDTNHYEYDLKGIKKWIFGFLFYRLPINNVKYVTVVSEHTKSRLIELFGTPEQKIHVIHNCYSNNFKQDVKIDINSPTKILQIGTKINKNLHRLINSVSGLNIELSIIGKLNKNLIDQLEKQGINYINKMNLSNTEIYNEYKNCDILAFISLREGFGLPIIEANAVGRPVITSNISSMPEVAKNAACIIDPTSEKEITEGMQKIIQDKAYRNQLITNGFENIKRFNPTLIAEKYETLYSKMITENEREF